MRIRAVRKLCDWLEAVHGSPKLQDPLAVIEYMYDSLAMKPLRTFPTTLMAAISFVEERGDVILEDRISQQGIVRRAAA
eukprot:6452520-Karenia_brevis.AAC.1